MSCVFCTAARPEGSAINRVRVASTRSFDAQPFYRLQSWLGKPAVAVTILTGLAALLRLFHLGYKPLTLDEASLYWFANGNIRHILEQNAAYNSAPPLFALLVGAVLTIGNSEAALRSVPCIAGVMAVPAIYFLARQFGSGPVAFFAALLAAVAPSQVEYSQQVREYSLAFLLSAFLLLAFCRFVNRQKLASAAWVAIVGIVSIFTQYGLAILFLSLNLIFLAMIPRLERPLRACGAWLAVLVITSSAALAVYSLSLKQQWVAGGRAAYYLAHGYWDGTLRSLGQMTLLGTEGIFFFAFPTDLVIAASILGVLYVLEYQRRTALWLFMTPMAVTFTAALLRAYPYLGARQTIFLTPMIYVFAAMGMAWLARWTRGRGVAIVLAGFMVAFGLRHTATYYMKKPENIRPVVAKLLGSAAESDAIYVHAGAVPAFEYYFRKGRAWIPAANPREEPKKFAEQLDEVLSRPGRVWLVVSHIPKEEVHAFLMYVSRQRPVEQVHEEDGAWLFLAS